MKIEKLNDNQIKCTLDGKDLAQRHLKISELAYGSEKAQSLFRDMLRQAGFECGFEADNTPLMIEAIPKSADTLVLIITKVEDPEELDTRFSRFSPFLGSTEGAYENSEEEIGDMMDLFGDTGSQVPIAPAPDFGQMLQEALTDDTPDRSFLFVFSGLPLVMNLATATKGFKGTSSLYKDPEDGSFLLVVSMGSSSKEEFHHLCSLASEFGRVCSLSDTGDCYLAEHCDVLIAENALEKLCK